MVSNGFRMVLSHFKLVSGLFESHASHLPLHLDRSVHRRERTAGEARSHAKGWHVAGRSTTRKRRSPSLSGPTSERRPAASADGILFQSFSRRDSFARPKRLRSGFEAVARGFQDLKDSERL